MVAAGFLLRVLGGAAAIDVPASGWLLVCTGLLATFLGLGKRAHELAWAERSGGGKATRAALAGYRMSTVRPALIVLGVAACGAYVAYTLDPRTIAFFGTRRLVWTTPFVGLGFVRFLMLAMWRPRDDSPTEAMFKRSRGSWPIFATRRLRRCSTSSTAKAISDLGPRTSGCGQNPRCWPSPKPEGRGP